MPGGWIASTYLHGFFDNDALRETILNNPAKRNGLRRRARTVPLNRHTEYDRLADTVCAHLDMDAVYRIAGILLPHQ